MATKEAKALLLTAGTVFLSAAVAMASITPPNYIAAGVLGAIGLGAFYIREIAKEERQAEQDITQR